MQILLLSALTLLLVGTGSAQTSSQQSEGAITAQTSPPPPVAAGMSAGYVLGPGDQISVHVLGVEEISDKPTSVDLNGYLDIPLAGQVRASGLTIEQLESELASRLKTYVRRPDVSVTVVEFRSQPVSIIGAVRNPGTLQLRGRKTLLEILSEAGGVDNVNAGSILKITRRKEWGPIPLPNAKPDATNEFSVAQINLKALISAANPAENIQIKP